MRKAKRKGGKVAARRSHARAREGPPKSGVPSSADVATDRLSRVLWIRQLIVEGAWQPGLTGRALAFEWGCSVKTVETFASEAHRQLRAGMDKSDFADLRAKALAFHQLIAHNAYRAGEYSAATKAMQAFCAVAGIGATPGGATRPQRQSSEPGAVVFSLADLERMAAELDAQADERRRREAEAKAAEAATALGDDEDDEGDDVGDES